MTLLGIRFRCGTSNCGGLATQLTAHRRRIVTFFDLPDGELPPKLPPQRGPWETGRSGTKLDAARLLRAAHASIYSTVRY